MNGIEAFKTINNYNRLKVWLEVNGKDIMNRAIKDSNGSLRNFAKWSNYSATYVCRVRTGKEKMSMPMLEELIMKGYVKEDEVFLGF